MKVLLVEPSEYKANEQDKPCLDKKRIRDIFYLSPTLPYLAALASDSAEIDIAYEVSKNFKEQYDFESYNLIGITCQTSHLKRALELAREFRKLNKHIVIGGPVTVEDNHRLVPILQRFCSTVIIGEADELWLEFLDDFKNGIPKKIYKSKQIVRLEGIPVPRYELIDFSQFAKPHILPIMSSRGCPRACSFCSEFLYGSWRLRPVNEVVNELEILVNKFGIRKFAFRDDNLLVDKKRTERLLGKIMPLNIEWSCQTDLSISRYPELVKLAIQSGMKSISLGLESINSKTQLAVKKRLINLAEARDFLVFLYKSSVETQVNVIFGFIEDSSDVFSKTVDFLIESKVSLFFPSILYPIPGTPIYKKLLKEDRLISKHPPGIEDPLFINFNHPRMKKQQIIEGYLYAKKRFYRERINPVFWLGKNKNVWGAFEGKTK